MRYMLPLLVFLIISAFLWKGLSNDPHQLQSALVGKPVPEFSYPDLLNPSHVVTNQVFLGHVSLLNVWATWCITCHVEHPILLDIARSKTVQVFGLNYKDDGLAAQQWLQKYGDPFQQIIFDPKGTLAIDLGVYGTPETFVIDARGIIRYRYIGPISPDDWQEKIEPVVKRWSMVNPAIPTARKEE